MPISRKLRGHKKRVGAEIDAPALFPQRVPSERCLLLIVIAFRALAPLPSLRVGIVIVTTAVVSIHTPTVTLVVVRPGKSGGHGGGHKHYHERSCSKNFNDTFQTSSPPSPSQGVRAILRQEKELTPVACYVVTSALWRWVWVWAIARPSVAVQVGLILGRDSGEI